jgi:pyruvate dehydrogenase E2 component (dihydrolipoamide acetyltransferase)
MGEATTAARLGAWLKREGDPVVAGEPIAEVETDKTNFEIEAPASGILRILIAAGSDGIMVGARLGMIEPDAAGVSAGNAARERPEVSDGPRYAAPADADESASAIAPEPTLHLVPAIRQPSGEEAPNVSNVTGVDATPLAKKIAQATGLDLSTVLAGDGVRITKADVELALGKRRAPESLPVTTAPAASAIRPAQSGQFVDHPLSSMRRVTASRLALSKQTIPHFYLHSDCRVDALIDLRKQWNVRANGSGTKVTVTDILVFAVSRALKKVPIANAAWIENGIRVFENVDIAVAVNTPAGLITPIVRGCEQKTLITISREIASLAERARAGSLKPTEYTGGTLTISNLGMFRVTSIMPIINPPQACILGFGAIEARAVVEDGRIVAGQIMACTLAADHRVIDGVAGAEFLTQVRRFLEDPVSLTLV